MSGGERVGIFGIGVFWSDWRKDRLPSRYRDRPQDYDRRQMDLIVGAGGTGIQIDLGWCRLEPEPGRWDWEVTDRRVEEARKRGLELAGYLGNTPDWAVPEAEPGQEKLPGYRTPPDERFAGPFTEYCRAVAGRYRGAVGQYTFWNEPNGCGWVNGGCSNMGGFPLYTRWLKRAYRALKGGDPGCLVGAGALDYHSGVPAGWRYLQGIYEEGGKPFFDAVEIHPYAPGGLHWQAIRDTRRVMLEHGDGHKPIWIGEYGWPKPLGRRAVRDLEAVLDLLRRGEFHFITHARYLVVSDLNEGLYGLCGIDLKPRAVYHAFRRFPKVFLPAGAPPAIPDAVRPDAPAGGGSAEDPAAGGLRLARPDRPLEYREEFVFEATWPSAAEKPIEVLWRVDGELQSAARGLHFSFVRAPGRLTTYTVSVEARCRQSVLRDSCPVVVRPYLSQAFTVLIDPPSATVGRAEILRLSTRVLNRSSHDLAFRWSIDGRPVPGATGSLLEIRPDVLSPGEHTIGVTCANAGAVSSDTARVGVRPQTGCSMGGSG